MCMCVRMSMGAWARAFWRNVCIGRKSLVGDVNVSAICAVLASERKSEMETQRTVTDVKWL